MRSGRSTAPCTNPTGRAGVVQGEIFLDIERFDIYASGMTPPPREPVGLQVTHTAKTVSRAFDDALAGVGGSLPAWLVLMSLKAHHHGMQRELAEAVGIEGPTLTHHLNRMEAEGLVRRNRDPENRRVHRVELTDQGEEAFDRCREAVVDFDRRLRAGIGDEEVAALGELLARLRLNASGPATRGVLA
jgi:MarR family transcriptional regulator, transcriptional regulator for hemolysin